MEVGKQLEIGVSYARRDGKVFRQVEHRKGYMPHGFDYLGSDGCWRNASGCHTEDSRKDAIAVANHRSDPRHPEHRPEVDPGEGWELCDETAAQEWFDFHQERWKKMDHAGHHHPTKKAYRRRLKPSDAAMEAPPKLADLAGIWKDDEPHDCDSTDADWNYHCPSEEEVPDHGHCIVTIYDAIAGRRTGMATGAAVRSEWRKRYDAWMLAPAPASPPYEPPKGWARIDHADEDTWPTERDGNNSGNVLAEHRNGHLTWKRWDALQENVTEYTRWCTIAWVREATA